MCGESIALTARRPSQVWQTTSTVDEFCWSTCRGDIFLAQSLRQSSTRKYPYFCRYPNFLIIQCRISRRKPPYQTRSLAIADGPRDASCQLKSCQLLRNSVETTCTTSSEQIQVMKLEGYSGRMCTKYVHSTMTRSSRFHCPVGVINKPTTGELWISPVYPVPTTCCGEIFTM